MKTHIMLFLLVIAVCMQGAYATPDSVYAVVRGDSVVIWNTDAVHYCDVQFQFDVNISHGTISVTEIDTARNHPRCICAYDLSVSLSGLQSGSYTANVYRRFFVRYNRDTVLFVGGTSFVIGPPVGPLAQRFYQSPCKVTADVDVFPIALGNQWSYGYNYDWEDDPWINPMWSWRDTGTVNVRISGRTVAPDSTRWTVHQIGLHWSSYNFGPWSGPTARVDTFEIVEFAAGNHWMYRTGPLDEVRRSVLPFVPDLVDTARIFRFAAVDTAGTRRLRTHEVPMGVFFDLTFTRDVGLAFVFMTNGITGWPHYSTHHVLRSSTIVAAGEPDEAFVASDFSLMQNYPNPFNPVTNIGLRIADYGLVTLKVYDLLGREVATLVNEVKQPGAYTVQWNASGVASGVYVYRLQAGELSETKKLVVIK